MKLVIGNKNYSSWSLRPWLLLSVHGIPFEEIRIPLYREDSRAALSAYTDAGKVPVLHDGSLVVWDSLAICEYISEQYLEGAGWPADPAERAEARSCSAEMHSGFFEIRGRMPMNCRAVGRRVDITGALQAEIDRVDTMWSGLRRRFADRGPWLFGDFSIADCMYAPVASRFRTYDIVVSSAAAGYVSHVLGTREMASWYEHGAQETEVLEMSEVGA